MRIIPHQSEDASSCLVVVPVQLGHGRTLTACALKGGDDLDVYHEDGHPRQSGLPYRSTVCCDEHVRARVQSQEFRNAERLAQERFAIGHDIPFCVRRSLPFRNQLSRKDSMAYVQDRDAVNGYPGALPMPSIPTPGKESGISGGRSRSNLISLPPLNKVYSEHKSVTPVRASINRKRSFDRLPAILRVEENA
ncbi:uncharacterized protein Tco025E_04996 [Trypanosoma conorhini]|uniref:Uncharacterized protein n=1 Tax=Trypanosoma conorhini TaxID=83891 RepID=A0A422PGQ0_9TRYP|nr:uncharacterized protein Tco025E_04996 [Trypanosoma conorhini]RNF16871.1 hypothetical protein Tco025E_04996 [Trypanosoma conorhini]